MSDDNKDDAKAEGEGAEQLTIRVKDQVSHSILKASGEPLGTRRGRVGRSKALVPDSWFPRRNLFIILFTDDINSRGMPKEPIVVPKVYFDTKTKLYVL